MAISIDVTSHVAGILLKHGYAVNNAASLPGATAAAETAEALMLAERCGDDFALDSARLARGIVLYTVAAATSGWNCWRIVRRPGTGMRRSGSA